MQTLQAEISCPQLIGLKGGHYHKIAEITENARKCLLSEYEARISEYHLNLAISDQQSVLKFGCLYVPALQLHSEFELRLKQTFRIFDLEEMVIKMAHHTWNILEVYFYAINTNAQALLQSAAKKQLQIGEFLTRGLALSAGSGGNPLLGEQAADESKEAIAASLKGSDLVFITAGMGGGSDSGATPVVAQISREAGYLTVGVITYLFSFEGCKRSLQAGSNLVIRRKT